MKIPCVGVLCGQVSGFEILLGEGGDIELGARISKQILLIAFDPLTLTFSLLCALIYLCLASFHIAHSYYMLGLFVCASLVLNHESFI